MVGEWRSPGHAGRRRRQPRPATPRTGNRKPTHTAVVMPQAPTAIAKAIIPTMRGAIERAEPPVHPPTTDRDARRDQTPSKMPPDYPTRGRGPAAQRLPVMMPTGHSR